MLRNDRMLASCCSRCAFIWGDSWLMGVTAENDYL